MKTTRFSESNDDITTAGDLLRAGQLVAFRTETVYGLGANAHDQTAVQRIYTAKGRPSFNPLIVHIPSIDATHTFARWSDEAHAVADAFWPGPLTLVLPLAADHGIAPAVLAGNTTIALRVPQTASAQALLRAAGCPIAAPSANRSGQISPTTADHVMTELSGRIEAVIDDGPCRVGIESTIYDPVQRIILRHGSITGEQIAQVTGHSVTYYDGSNDHSPTAPGQLSSHYAPNAALRLNVTAPAAGDVYIGYGAYRGELTLSAQGDAHEAAAALYATLRRADDLAMTRGAAIAIAPVPDEGIGRALNDRLTRAAAPKSA